MIKSYDKFLKESVEDMDPYGEEKWVDVFHYNVLSTVEIVVPNNLDANRLVDIIRTSLFSIVDPNTPYGEFLAANDARTGQIEPDLIDSIQKAQEIRRKMVENHRVYYMPDIRPDNSSVEIVRFSFNFEIELHDIDRDEATAMIFDNGVQEIENAFRYNLEKNIDNLEEEDKIKPKKGKFEKIWTSKDYYLLIRKILSKIDIRVNEI